MRRNFPRSSPWVQNKIARERVPPNLDWLINRLAANAAPGTKDNVIVNHAREIRSVIQEIWTQRQHKARKERLGAEDVRGYAKELVRLQAAARKALSIEQLKPWNEAWVTAPPEIRKVLLNLDITRVQVSPEDEQRFERGEIVFVRPQVINPPIMEIPPRPTACTR